MAAIRGMTPKRAGKEKKFKWKWIFGWEVGWDEKTPQKNYEMQEAVAFSKRTHHEIFHNLDSRNETQGSKDSKGSNNLYRSKGPTSDDDDQIKDQPSITDESPSHVAELQRQFDRKNDQKG